MSYFQRWWITKVQVFIKLLRASKYKITNDGNLYKFNESSQRFNLLQLLKRNIEEYKWSEKKLRMRSQIDFAGPWIHCCINGNNICDNNIIEMPVEFTIVRIKAEK